MVKSLICHMCCGWLPTCVRFKDKEVQCPTNYVSCDGFNKDLARICFECPFYCAGLAYEWTLRFIEKNSMVDTIFRIVTSVITRDFVVVLWSILK